MTDITRQCPSASCNPAGAAFVLGATGSSILPVISGTGNMVLLRDRVTSNPTVSCSQHLLGAADTWRALRTAQIKALRGKYRDVLTPSDEFTRQKQKDIARARDLSWPWC